MLLYCNRSQITPYRVKIKSHALDYVSCVLFCSSQAMTSSVIYYSTDARKNEIYLLNTENTGTESDTGMSVSLFKKYRYTKISDIPKIFRYTVITFLHLFVYYCIFDIYKEQTFIQSLEVSIFKVLFQIFL